jgi:ABC-type dipeptide/oligopeptide/nickel transport system ATPase subunit
MEKFLQRNFTILLITHDYSIINEMVQQYPGMLPHIYFTDLQLTAHGLKQENFSARDYQDWHAGLKSFAARREPGSKPVLKVESRITIFKRKMIISKDAQGIMERALEVYPGEMVYLKAGSGVGKTSLAKCILGLLPGAAGIQFSLGGLTFNDKSDTKVWRRKIWGKVATMVFQHADESLNLNARVKDVFGGLPLTAKMNTQRLIQQLQWIFNIPLDSGFLGRKVASLSGGQKQRLNLMRALILDTGLIILDEPLNGLGFESIQKILELLREKQTAGQGILLISHNEDIFDKLIPAESIYYLNFVPHPAHTLDGEGEIKYK